MITVPEAAARICVPQGAEMSMPWCIRPQRQPNPLVMTPLTGQMKPLAETPLPLDPLRGVVGAAAAAAARAARILAPSEALAASIAARASSASWRFSVVLARRGCFLGPA